MFPPWNEVETIVVGIRMSHKIMSLEEAPLNQYHKSLTVRAGSGWFIDGYILSIIGVVLIHFSNELGLDSFWQGVIAAASIIGICLGGVAGGLLTDKFGRSKLFLIPPLLFIIFSITQYFVQSVEALFSCRLLIGIGVGIEYTVGSSLLTEFLPKKSRGPRISSLVVLWFIGAAFSYWVGHSILSYMGSEGWRLVLASPAVIGLIILLMRLKTFESPRWLLSQGRNAEAETIIKTVYGSSFSTENINYEKAEKKLTLKTLIYKNYLSRLIFVSIFWACSVMPVFAVYSFAPRLLEALNFQGEWSTYGSVFLTTLFVAGCWLGAVLINKMGRRRMLMHSFLWSLIALVGLGYFAEASPFVVLFFFGTYAICIGGAQILTIVYPNEIFPTEVRAMAVGVCTSLSKVGVVIGTWLAPIAIDTIGIENTMYVAAIINLIGLVISFIYAIETSHLSLEEASAI